MGAFCAKFLSNEIKQINLVKLGPPYRGEVPRLPSFGGGFPKAPRHGKGGQGLPAPHCGNERNHSRTEPAGNGN